MNKISMLLALALWIVIGAASASALNITGGTLTLKAGEGFNFSQQRVISEQNGSAFEADILYHEYGQTRERGMKLTRGNALGALLDIQYHIYHYEVSMFKTTGQIEDCISKNYYYKTSIAPILGRAYCVVLDRKDEVLDFAQRRVVRLQVVKMNKDSVTLEWKYLDRMNEPAVEEPALMMEKEEPIEQAPKNLSVTPPTISEAPAAPAKKIPKKHDWKPWAIGWAIVFVLVVGYELFWGFGRRK